MFIFLLPCPLLRTVTEQSELLTKWRDYNILQYKQQLIVFLNSTFNEVYEGSQPEHTKIYS